MTEKKGPTDLQIMARVERLLSLPEPARGFDREPTDYCNNCAQELTVELLAALRLCVAWMPCATVRSWPPGFRLRDEALKAARAAISKAGKT